MDLSLLIHAYAANIFVQCCNNIAQSVELHELTVHMLTV